MTKSAILSAYPDHVSGFFVAMNTKILVLLLLTLPFLFLNKQVQAEKLVVNTNPIAQVESKKIDNQAEILAAYLAKYDSPLQYQAQDFIDAAKTYDLDWKMLPAISGVESTFGKQIPGGFNAWGWGVYGTQAIYFKSWRDAMFTIAQGLRENYLNKGLTDPYSINPVYAASPSWGWKVAFFMQDMDKFAKNFESNKQQTAQVGDAPKIAAVSGQIALR